MPALTRRNALKSGLAFAAGTTSLAACGAAPGARSGITRLHVMGMIHGRHRTSEAYSLDILRRAVLKAKPDIILTEIPPDRVARALSTYADTGKVDEPRTNVFPEYTDVIIPLAAREGWKILGCAAWTPKIAQDRRVALSVIEKNPARADQWSEYRAALGQFAQDVRGKSDDPHFIHTAAYDRHVAASRTPYARFFDADLGAGGWTQINDGHNALINQALDSISGQGLSALVTFGAAHKYKILESVSLRRDLALQDTASLFA